ncbi:aldehyde dehydrogenase family protein [Actinomadura sp. 3N407]|uniref:aldehyde dehydrogenase family protein n=1 Tax=Actinomadura sp. 3N407 TaxID=3457423 RepID=UPI003FCD40B6
MTRAEVASQQIERFRPREPYQMIIGGRWLPGDEGTFDAVDPSTGEVWATIPEASEAQVRLAVDEARRALVDWRRSSLGTRQRILSAIADRVEADPDRWARLLPTENGRPMREAYVADVPACTDIFRYFAGVVRGWTGDQIPTEDADALVYTTREPLGVIAAVLPWNSPIITLANKIAPALAAGNTVVVKPSEFASASILEFARLVDGLLPDGVLNVVTGGGAVGAALVSHPDVAKVTLTGGGPTARKIMAAAAESLTPCLMELGGKSAMIVTQDADLETAVADAAKGIFLSNGEVCVASSRLLLHEDIADEFLGRIASVAASIKVGDALDPETQMGPLVSRSQFERVSAYIEGARAEGLVQCAGSESLDLPASNQQGFFVRPTIFENAKANARIASEEIFGPVVVTERYTDDDDAVARANGTRYGLAAGVWTLNVARAHRIAGQLEAGIVWVNKWFDLATGVPMGGIKDSGFGRELCRETLLEYSAPKVVNVDLGSPRPQLWG